MIFDCLLFDFDGTLVDTNDIVIESLKHAVCEVTGRAPSDAEIFSVLGLITREQLEFFDHARLRDLMSSYRTFYDSNKSRLIKPYPRVAENLAKLRTMGCSMAIISSKDKKGIDEGLDMFGLGGYFDVIIDADAVSRNKPHPESALKAIAALGDRADRTLLVGDSPYDIGCAQNAGIKSALVSWTIFPSERFDGLKPGYILKSMDDLPGICKPD